MKLLITNICLLSVAALGGCASTYGNLVSGSNLGAQEYVPAVLPNPGMEGQYSQVLGICRRVAVNRQITAAEEAQLSTVTGVVKGSVDGAIAGMQVGSMFKQVGLGGSVNRSMGIGMFSGFASSLAGSFADGSQRDAAETKDVLLNCLRRADPSERFYKVIE
jgi:hypothetical protein